VAPDEAGVVAGEVHGPALSKPAIRVLPEANEEPIAEPVPRPKLPKFGAIDLRGGTPRVITPRKPAVAAVVPAIPTIVEPPAEVAKPPAEVTKPPMKAVRLPVPLTAANAPPRQEAHGEENTDSEGEGEDKEGVDGEGDKKRRRSRGRRGGRGRGRRDDEGGGDGTAAAEAVDEAPELPKE